MLKKDTILVVDDDEEIGFMLTMMLEHKGFSVLLAKRIDQAKEIINNKDVDLVILDMLIAGEKGTDLCSYLKNNDETSALPVMMITALPDAKNSCMQAGADDFLSKPFDIDEINAKIHALLSINRFNQNLNNLL